MQLHCSNIFTPGGIYLHYYCSHYLSTSAGEDLVSHSLVKFKQAVEPDLTQWIDLATSSTPGGIPTPGIIIRALHHNETFAQTSADSPLDRLGIALATKFQTSYRPDLLQKHHPTTPLHQLDRPGRESQTTGIYYLPKNHNLLNIKVLLIDDVLTTGTTAAAILQTLFLAGADPIGIFTLAKAIPDLSF